MQCNCYALTKFICEALGFAKSLVVRAYGRDVSIKCRSDSVLKTSLQFFDMLGVLIVTVCKESDFHDPKHSVLKRTSAVSFWLKDSR